MPAAKTAKKPSKKAEAAEKPAPEPARPLFNVLNHRLVPLHEKLTGEAKKAVLEEFAITPEQLPKILASDPACKAIGAKAGDIVKITRQSKTAGEAFVFRYCVETA